MKKYISVLLAPIMLCGLLLSSCSDNGTESTLSGSYQKRILEFTFKKVPSLNFDSIDYITNVSEETRSVTDTLKFGVDLKALVPTIIISDKATISPASGVAQDFSSPVIYTVTSEDGTKKVYVVTMKTNSGIDFSLYATPQVNTTPSDSIIMFGNNFRSYKWDKIVLSNNATGEQITSNAYADTDSTIMFKLPPDLALGIYSYAVYVGDQFTTPGSTLTVVGKPSSSSAPFINSLDKSEYQIANADNGRIIINGKNFKGSAAPNVNFIPDGGGSPVVVAGISSNDGRRVAVRMPDNFTAGSYHLQVEVDGLMSNQFTGSIKIDAK